MHLWSRNGRDWSAEFVAITAAIIAMPVTRIVLDGEAVAHCNALLGRSGCATACVYAFDLLHLGVDDLRPLELGDRARSCEPSSGSRSREDMFRQRHGPGRHRLELAMEARGDAGALLLADRGG